MALPPDRGRRAGRPEPAGRAVLRPDPAPGGPTPPSPVAEPHAAFPEPTVVPHLTPRADPRLGALGCSGGPMASDASAPGGLGGVGPGPAPPGVGGGRPGRRRGAPGPRRCGRRHGGRGPPGRGRHPGRGGRGRRHRGGRRGGGRWSVSNGGGPAPTVGSPCTRSGWSPGPVVVDVASVGFRTVEVDRTDGGFTVSGQRRARVLPGCRTGRRRTSHRCGAATDAVSASLSSGGRCRHEHGARRRGTRRTRTRRSGTRATSWASWCGRTA